MKLKLFTLLLILFIPSFVEAQGLRETVTNKEQRTKSLSSGNKKGALTDAAKKRKEENELKRQQKEYDYNRACEYGTIDAYRNFIYEYPDSDKYSNDMRNRINDYELWNSACHENTIRAYNDYLKDSEYKSHESEAKAKIVNLESIEKWTILSRSNSIDSINAYMSKYPNSPKLEDAKLRIHQLKGVQYYRNGDLKSAYNEFTTAGGRSALDVANRDMYDKAYEYSEYLRVKSNSTESQMLAFMSAYPSSPYYDEISNMVAVSKARSLTKYSNQYDYNGALSYAKDYTTRSTVNNYIERAKQANAEYRKELKREEWRENGGLVNMAIEFVDFGLNFLSPSSNRSYNTLYYNMGIGFRIGNYKSPVQFEVGVRPGIIVFHENINDKYEFTKQYTKGRFHMPVYGKFKINIGGGSSKFYIFGEIQYNAIRIETVERQFGYKAGFGVQSRNWDWSLYFKNEFGSYEPIFWEDREPGCQYLGTSLVRYFRIY